MNIVIVAGGLGTRFNELSCFPKILLPTINKDSLLMEQMQYFNSAESVSLVINTKYFNMVDNYVKVNNIPIKVIETKNSNGSYNSLNEVKDKLPSNDVLFLWSDIMFRSNVDIVKYIQSNVSCKKPVIFTTDNNSVYRYNFDGITIDPRTIIQNGNVPGSYFIPDVNEFFKNGYHNGLNYDIIDELLLNWPGNIEKCNFPDLIEFKGLNEYKSIIHNAPTQYNRTRFFNSITKLDNGNLLKKLEDIKYANVISNEINWYQLLDSRINGYTPTPKIYKYEEDSFEMEYLKDYISLYQYITENKLDDKNIQYIYNNIYTAMDIIHNSYKEEIPFETYMKDLYKEVVQKIIDRCDAIKDMIISYDKPSMVKLLIQAYSILLNNTEITNSGNVMYYFCHGDLHSSNIMINPKTTDIKFIDPRNYFGYTVGLGNLDYEFSKLLYSIRGFDHVNNNKLIYKVDNIQCEYLDNKIDYLDNINYKIWIAITFIGLAGYTSGDIMRANITYEYGIELLKKYIKEYENN